MRSRDLKFSLVLGALLLLGGLILLSAGCGEKIAIPEAEGVFSIAGYTGHSALEVTDPRGIKILQGSLFLLTADSLTKRSQNLDLVANVEPVTGLGDATSLCGASELDLVFVFDQEGSELSWYEQGFLEWQGSVMLPEVQSAVSMTTSPLGVELAPGAETFLYISDPDSAVVHRYAFDPVVGPVPYGILCRAGGESARFVNVPAGLATEPETGYLAVCDADTNRNWVIRFDGTPDMNDVTADPDDQDPMRGLVEVYQMLGCATQPVQAYVLGDAPDCDESDWEGAPSSENGLMHAPQAVTVDGSLQILVADTMNNRVQLFKDGVWTNTSFIINDERDSRPMDISVLDRQVGLGQYYYSAYVYVVLPAENLVSIYVSQEESSSTTTILPPPQ